MANKVLVFISYGPDGVIEKVTATGHAGNIKAGNNIVCAAISILLRTAYETIYSYKNVVVKTSGFEIGNLEFDIISYSKELIDRLKGIGDFLNVGLFSLKRDYPDLIEIQIEDKRRN